MKRFKHISTVFDNAPCHVCGREINVEPSPYGESQFAAGSSLWDEKEKTLISVHIECLEQLDKEAVD